MLRVSIISVSFFTLIEWENVTEKPFIEPEVCRNSTIIFSTLPGYLRSMTARNVPFVVLSGTKLLRFSISLMCSNIIASPVVLVEQTKVLLTLSELEATGKET